MKKFDITVERRYPYPIEAVWRALTTREALAQWLMDSGFRPSVGHAFEMRCENDAGGTDVFRCKVLELEPPTRMVWSWATDDERLGQTFVEFLVEPAGDGTLLRIRHHGEGRPSFIEVFESGWPDRLADVEAFLRGRR